MKFRDWDINLKVRLIGEAFTGISFWMVFPFLTVYFSDSLGRGITSLLLVLSQVIAVFCGLFGGYFADQYGRRRMMLIAIAGEIIGYGLFALASFGQIDSAVIGFVGFTIASIFFSFYNPAASAMIADVVNEEERSYVFSVFYTVSNLSIIVGPLIGAILFIKYRFYLLVLVTLSYIVLYVLLYIFTYETAPIVKEGKNQNSTSMKDILVTQFKNYQIIFSDKIFFIFIVSGILVAQTFMQLDMFIPLKVDETIDVATLLSIHNFEWNVDSAGLYSILLGLNGGLVVLFSVRITKFMMRYPEKISFIWSTVLYGISIFIIGLFSNPWIYIVGIIIFTIGEILKVGVQQNFIAMIAPEDMRGMYFSAASLRYNVGRVLAPLSITLTTVIGFEMTGIILAICCFISTYLYHYMFKLFNLKNIRREKAIN